MKLRVATCQFPVGSDVRKSLEYVARRIRTAKDWGVDVAHLPEACLSHYAGVDDLAPSESFEWARLRVCTQKVLDLARESRIWVVLGSAHRLTAPRKPHNSLYRPSQAPVARASERTSCSSTARS